MAVRLTWDDNNANETEHVVYRSDLPINLASLPVPVATLGADVTEYTVAPDDWGYFIVSASDGVNASYSAEFAFNIPDGDVTPPDGEFHISEWFQAADKGDSWTFTVEDTSAVLADGSLVDSVITNATGVVNSLVLTSEEDNPNLYTDAGGYTYAFFDGANDRLSHLFASPLSMPGTIMMALENNDVATHIMATGGDADNRWQISNSGGDDIIAFAGDTAVLTPGPLGRGILTVEFNENSTRAWLNGTLVAEGVDAGDHSLAELFIGALWDGTFEGEFNLYSFTIIDKLLTDQEREAGELWAALQSGMAEYFSEQANFPWGQLSVLDQDFHQGFAIDPLTGNLIAIDNGQLELWSPFDELLVTNADPESDIGSGSYTDGTVFNGELVFRTGAVYAFYDVATLAFIRQFTGTVGGSTLCRGPDETKLYSFSFSSADRYWVVDPADGSEVEQVLFTGDTITEIQGSVWSERDQVFYVSVASNNSLASVTATGVVTANVFTYASTAGEAEGLDTYQGQIYGHIYQGASGVYILHRDGVGTDPAQGSITLENGEYFADDLPSSGSGSITILTPPDVVAGDYLVMIQQTDGTDTIALPAGWTELHTVQRGGGSGYTANIYGKVAGASEPDVVMADYGAQMGHMVRVRGQAPGDPTVTSYFPPLGESSTYKFPDVTSTGDNALWLAFTHGTEDATRGTVDTFSNLVAPNYRAAQVVDSLTHPFGNGGTFGILSAEIPTPATVQRWTSCAHAFSELSRASVVLVFEEA